MIHPHAPSRWLSRAMSPAIRPSSQIALVLTLFAVTTANAQTPPPNSVPGAWADPSAPVPTVVYRSVFAGTPMGVETQTADWRKANAEVGEFKRGHVDILKWEEAEAQKQMQNPAPAPATSQRPDAVIPAAPGMHKH